MCSRYSIASLGAKQYETFSRIDTPPMYRARYNAAPSQSLPIITGEKPDEATMATWGFVPPWLKEKSRRLVNARAESINEKATFRESSEKYRCIVPADGFFEWAEVPGENYKQPYYIRRKDEAPFGMAGLYRITSSGDLEFAIVTVAANDLVAPVHDRMPAILPEEKTWDWISQGPFKDVMGLLAPAPEELLETVAITRLVNNPQNDTPDVLKPLK